MAIIGNMDSMLQQLWEYQYDEILCPELGSHLNQYISGICHLFQDEVPLLTQFLEKAV